VCEEHKEFVEAAYRESFSKYNRLQELEKIWDGVWEEITLDTVKDALKKY